MALAKKCDRCGKYWDYDPYDKLTGAESSLHYRGYPIDICSECLAGLLKYLSGAEAVDFKEENSNAKN